MCIVVPSLQQLPASVPCPAAVHQSPPSLSTIGSHISSPRPLCNSPQAVPLIEHLRRLKNCTPTSPLLAGTQSTSTLAEPFQTSHDIGLKDLLLSSDEEMTSAKAAGSAEREKLTQFIRQSTATSPLPLVAVNGLADARTFDVTGRHARPAVILKQLLEDRSEHLTSSPIAGEQFDGSPSGAKQSLSISDLMFGYNSPASVPSTSPSLLTPSNQVQPPFVQLITSVEDTAGLKQASPTMPLTFSIAEPTSVSHLWSPPSFTSQLNCVDQLGAASSIPQSQTSAVPVKTGVQSSMSSQSHVTVTSNGALQLKLTQPRMSASRNTLLRVSVLFAFFLCRVSRHFSSFSAKDADNMQPIRQFPHCV